MTDAAIKAETREIIVEETFPHSASTVWQALTTGSLMTRWLMRPSGFELVEGNRFTYQTKPAGEWDGTISCEILSVIPCERLVYSWSGGHPSNIGYGAPLDTVVTFELMTVSGGTRLRLTHSGFSLPRNETAFAGMSEGWKGVVTTIGAIAGELH